MISNNKKIEEIIHCLDNKEMRNLLIGTWEILKKNDSLKRSLTIEGKIVIWRCICEVIQKYEIYDLKWEALCAIQNVDIYDVIDQLPLDFTIQYAAIIKRMRECSGVESGNLYFESVINNLFLYIIDNNIINEDKVNSEKIKSLIIYRSKYSKEAVNRFGNDSEVITCIYSNYPLKSKLSQIIQKDVYALDTERSRLVNVNCNTSDKFLMQKYSDFYNKYQGDERLGTTIRIFIFYFSKECMKLRREIAYEDFTIKFLKEKYSYFENLSKSMPLQSQGCLGEILVNFFRFIEEEFERKYNKSLHSDIWKKVLQSKSIYKIFRENYEVMYYNKLEPAPYCDKICIIPNQVTMKNSNINNNRFLFIDVCEIPDVFRKDYLDYLWNNNVNMLDKVTRFHIVCDFLCKLSESLNLNKKVISMDRENALIDDKFLFDYRMYLEIKYVNSMTLKANLKEIRRFLSHISGKYGVSKGVLKILSLKNLEQTNEGKPMTEKDLNLIYNEFIKKENVEMNGKLYRIVFEIFLLSNIRIGEILNLEVDCLYVEEGSSKKYIQYISKTSNGEKIMSVATPEIAKLVNEAIEYTKLFRGKGELDKYIFVEPYKRKALSSIKRIDFKRYFYKIIADISEKLENDNYHPYNIRHTYMNIVCDEARKNNLSIKEIEAITNDSYKTIRKYYENRDKKIIMAEVMAGITLSDVDVSGKILKKELNSGYIVKNNLGKCSEEKCKIDISECLVCTFFHTFLNRIPIFEAEVRKCDKIAQTNSNEVIIREKIAEKKLLIKYLVNMYEMKGDKKYDELKCQDI